jgi:hypothetical protein
MRRLAALVCLVVAACNATPTASLPTDTLDSTPVAAPISPQPSSPGASGTVARWRVDVVNGPRPVIISITTDTSAWEWLVRAGEKRTLLDETGARPGGIEVISDVEVTGACTVLARATFSARRSRSSSPGEPTQARTT